MKHAYDVFSWTLKCSNGIMSKKMPGRLRESWEKVCHSHGKVFVDTCALEIMSTWHFPVTSSSWPLLSFSRLYFSSSFLTATGHTHTRTHTHDSLSVLTLCRQLWTLLLYLSADKLVSTSFAPYWCSFGHWCPLGELCCFNFFFFYRLLISVSKEGITAVLLNVF